MRVLHVIPSISRVHGGPSVAIETMTRALANAGAHVEIVTTDDDGAGHLDVPLGTPVVREGVFHWFFRKQTQFYKFSLPLTTWLARNVARYDVVHVHALFSYTTLPAAFFSARRHTPYIVRPLGTLNHYGMTEHHPRFKRISFALFERRIVQRAARLHYTSAMERAQAHAMGVTQPSVVIPLGIDVSRYDFAREKRWLSEHAPHLLGSPMILFLGRLDPIKGLELVLDAFALLRANGINAGLVIAGGGESQYVNGLKLRAAELGVSERIVWAGHVGDDEKRALLRAADIFVLPSYSENFGIAAVEAMAAGLPVVVSERVGVQQDIAAAEAGMIVPCEPEALARALEAFCTNEGLRTMFGARARRLVEKTFSLSAMVNALFNLYSQVIAEQRDA